MKAFERDGKMVKRCSRCTEIKELECFGVRPEAPDGRRGVCNLCKSPPKPKRKTQFEIDVENGFKVCLGCNESKDLSAYVCTAPPKRRYFTYCKECSNGKEREKRKARGIKKRVGKYRAYEMDGGMVKRCTKCQEIKDVDQFNRRNGTSYPDGLEYKCKVCDREMKKQYIANNPEAYSRYYKACRKRHYERHKERLYEEKRVRRLKPESKARRNAKEKERRDNDPAYRLLVNMRTYLNDIVEGKPCSTKELIGCTPEELVKHIEGQLKDGMTRDRLGRVDGGISIDHILPCALFDLSQESHQRACFHYTNLQPLWDSDNFSKQDRLEDGRRARDLTPEEKKAYLISKGYAHFFPPTDSSPPLSSSPDTSPQDAPSD